ncbi:hypothetical protein [Nonomuraea zeae]|uniref:Chaplin n=1 Tax=Nonomuraea zeae TaxID=1642303 RepID=A0A5S4FYT0_9ACTN|nr:hypothetical protein [Nonomuraea zeae]TMR25742.1 hypothetical protein ETD85_44970 [Nonomuraea zeae]
MRTGSSAAAHGTVAGTAVGVVVAAVAGVVLGGALLPGAAYADAKQGSTSLIGNVIIFNDEIVEPVSLPVSTCGGVLSLLSKAPSTCKDTSRVSDDDA